MKIKCSINQLVSTILLATTCCQGALAQNFQTTTATTPTPLRITAEQVVATAAQRQKAGATVQPPLTEVKGSYDYFAWPDTALGTIKSREEGKYVFFASDGGFHKKYTRYAGCITRTVGTLDNPLGDASVPPQETFIQSNPSVNAKFSSYSYVGGGPVMRVPEGLPGAGNLLMVYHAERNTQGGNGFYSLLGLAKSLDEGQTWQDLGEIIEPNQPYNPNLQSFDIGDPNLIIDPTRTYLLIHFQDWIQANNSTTLVSVARVPLVALLKTAFSCEAKPLCQFAKYYNGKWDQPGINGLSSNVLNAGWAGEIQIKYNSYLHCYLAILDDTQNISYAQSADGVNWTQTALLKSGVSQEYAAPVGLERYPNILGKTFYIYYTANPNGWTSANVHRLTVTLP